MSGSIQAKKPATALRAVLGVIGGAIVWMFGFFILAQVLVTLWPAYAIPARAWTQNADYTFSSLMSVLNACLWIIAEIAAGALAATIARGQRAVWVLAALVMAYLCFMHFYLVWSKIPWWYNVIVALSSGPAVLLGGRWAAVGRRAAALGMAVAS
jgi:hypothetical protein